VSTGPALEPSSRRPLPVWAVVFLAAVVVHVIVWWQYRADPFATTYISDALSYHGWGTRLADHGPGAEPVFHQAPLFPLLLSLVYRVLPETGWAAGAIALQVLLVSAAIACLVPLGRLCFGRTSAGVAAAMLALFHGPNVFYGMKLLPVPLALATQTGGLCLLILARRRGHPVLAATAGVVWGLACLTRSEMLLFVPVALAALAWTTDDKACVGRRRVKILAAYVLGLILILAPVTGHNLRQGDLVVVASSAGENLFIGNQRGAAGGHKPLHAQAGDIFSQRVVAQRIAEQARGRALRSSEVSGYWRGRAFDEIEAAPGAWVGLELKKLGRLLHPGDPTDIYSFALERDVYLSSLHGLAVTPWVLILLGGLGALLVLRRPPRIGWPLVALAAVHVAVLLLFFVDTRLRLPLLFALCPLAGHAIAEGLRHWRSRRAVVAIAGALVLVAMLAGTVLTRPTPRDVVRLASTLSMQQRLDDALEVLAPYVDAERPDALVLDQAGWVRHKRGEFDLASRHYVAALAGELPASRLRQIHTRLAMVYEQMGRREEAAAEHDAAVRNGERDGGLGDLKQATRLDPSWPAPREALESLGAD